MLSVDGAQDSAAEVAVSVPTVGAPGAVGGVVSGGGGGAAVVKSTGSEATETLPAAAWALRVTEYAVAGVSPVNVTPGVVVVSTDGPPDTWYAVTPTLSVEAPQVSVTAGVVGTWATGAPGFGGSARAEYGVVHD